MDLDLPARLAAVRIWRQASEVCVCKCPVRNVFQPETGLTQPVGGHLGEIIDARPLPVVMCLHGTVPARALMRHAAFRRGPVIHLAVARGGMIRLAMFHLAVARGGMIGLSMIQGTMIHSRIAHGPMVPAAMGHAHVLHGQQGALPQRRHLGIHTGARRERAARIETAIDGLGHDGECLIRSGTNHHVVGFGNTDLELVCLHGVDVLTVGLHHRHGQARNAEIVDGHGGGIDDAQAHALTRLEQGRPVILRPMTIDEAGIGGTGHIRDVGRAHAHMPPHHPVLDRRAQSVLAHVPEKITGRALLKIEAVAHLHEPGEDPVRVRECPVGEDENIFPVEGDRIAMFRLDDQRAVMAGLFLQAGMGMIPVGARLLHRKAVGECFARTDAGKGHARHAVHLKRHQDAMPVDGRIRVQPVGDPQCDLVALAPAQKRRRQLAIDGDGVAGTAVDDHGAAVYGKVELGSCRHLRTGRIVGRAAARPGRQQAGQAQGNSGAARCRQKPSSVDHLTVSPE